MACCGGLPTGDGCENRCSASCRADSPDPSRLLDLAPLPLLAAILLAIVVVLAIVVPLASLFIARRFPSGPPLSGAGGLPVAAWHPDPYGGEQERWWDGRDWSQWTRPRR